MSECKRKNCNNKTANGNKYCKYHQSKKEEAITSIMGVSLSLIGVTLFNKFK